MLYSLLIYHTERNILLYDKNFQDIDGNKIEMFGGFLSALKSFISEMNLSKSKDLRTIELGNNFVFITHVPETITDLVIVADKDDYKIIYKLVPKIVTIILNHKELFIESDYTSIQFKTFDQQITNLILSNKKIIDESFLKRKSGISESILDQKGEISIQLRKKLIEEKEFFYLRFKKGENLQDKLIIIKKLIEISKELKDESIIEYQKEAKALMDEIKDRKLKLQYFLNKTKASLKVGNYKDAYINFYSFSSKLKNITKPHIQKKYQNFAKILMNKDTLSKFEFSQVVSEILIMPDNINQYIL